MFCLKIKIMSNFRPLEVVGRGSETQLQVGGNLNDLFERFVGYRVVIWNWSFHLTEGYVTDLLTVIWLRSPLSRHASHLHLSHEDSS